jgi:phospholipid/cholesterol/gamma-HCH transport system permease protein
MMGLLGGLMSASIVLRMENNVYWAGVSSALDWRDLLECLVKSVFFGWISMSVAAYQGFYCHLNLKVRGAKAVSQAATRSVVYGSVLILWLDYVITGVLMER